MATQKILFISSVTVDDYVFSDNPRTFAPKDVIKEVKVDEATYARLVKASQEYYKVMEELRELVDPTSEASKTAGFVEAPTEGAPTAQPGPIGDTLAEAIAAPTTEVHEHHVPDIIPWEEQTPVPPPHDVDVHDVVDLVEDIFEGTPELTEREIEDLERERQEEEEAERLRAEQDAAIRDAAIIHDEGPEPDDEIQEQDAVEAPATEEDAEEEEEQEEDGEEEEEDQVPPTEGNEW